MSTEQSQRADLRFGTIPGMLAKRAAEAADHVAIEDGDVTLTYAQLAAKVREASASLIAIGVARGDRVGIWAPNLWEWIVSALAVHSAGGVVVPINTRYKGPEAAFILDKSEAKALLTVTGFLDTDYVALLRDAAHALPRLRYVVQLRGPVAPDATEGWSGDPPGVLDWTGFLALGAGVTDAQAAARAAEVEPDDLADILFTSGTTGEPKGAMCTHAQDLRTFGDWAHIVGLRDGDRYLVAMPFFHSFGYKAGWLAALMQGAVILPEPVFDVSRVLERIDRDRVTMLPGPPALYQSIRMHPDKGAHDLSSLRLAVTGAAAIPVELIRQIHDELGFETVLTAYGLTEACGVATMCRDGDDAQTIAQTSGRAIPDVEVRVVDPDGRALPAGEPGEIVVRGYNVMKGYFGAPEETARAIDGEGWLHTGDVGTLDEGGYLRITDRLKDMFIVGGFNAYPAEIEHTLLRMEGIADVAVIGVPDERLGEVGMAFVVPRAGATLTPDEVIAWSRAHMANFKVPRRVEICDALPRNATGKVTKFTLRERAARG